MPESRIAVPARPALVVFWLQGITLLWMLIECGLSLYAAADAHSPAMFAFGSDSLVELLSALAVLLQFLPRVSISARSASRAAGVLLFALAVLVCVTAIVSLALRLRPEPSCLGIGTTLAALIAMPVLAKMKRREALRSGNSALAADAVQSAMCAYMALIALAGLTLNEVFHIAWFDSAAALAALPLLLKEGREAWRGRACGCGCLARRRIPARRDTILLNDTLSLDRRRDRTAQSAGRPPGDSWRQRHAGSSVPQERLPGANA